MKRRLAYEVSLWMVLGSLFAAPLAIAGEKSDEGLGDFLYSPYAAQESATQVYWGDTHLHTHNSLDARSFGVRLGPREAYQFARGEEVVSTHGQRARLSRPLDFLVVSDHSDGMGAMNEIIEGNPRLVADPVVGDWGSRLREGGDVAARAAIDVIMAFTQGKIPLVLMEPGFAQTIWDDYLEIAEEFNEPGRFTAMIGYEWTPTENGNNLHRNVLYRDGAARARQVLPFTTFESFNPEDLWTWMESYEDKTGGQLLALAHNGNVSNGVMFPVEVNPETGDPLSGEYAARRSRWEPLYEVTQIKGDGETHPFLSPNDEFADYETWDKANLTLQADKERGMLQYEYAREALKNGLKIEGALGTNPYQFGMIGSTDSHTGLATASEENFFGKHSGVEPSADRFERAIGRIGERSWMSTEMAASGYAAVWATENTREALFDAMMRKEVYATTGPRMVVRFFGGWDFESEDADRRQVVRIGYAKGVPMGGHLAERRKGKTPTFLIVALKDPMSGHLDRVQVVKGWLDAAGQTHERVYDVVWSDPDTRKRGRDGQIPTVGRTVDIENATWTNSIGAAALAGVWEDPDFNPDQSAFYYARVIEIPTPRWTAYDAKRFGVKPPAGTLMTTQERAYTSPIWYSP